eukprot:TRINITY_DN31117_c0_g1_i1.p1 TRINITY_DN31117_c0_g1~~TRINITY_DN31117_c0_g1_i1.p1  ORF type:complete len:443 (-),score=136.11 TRINITY_DN31117_c0_g1_i1:174-1502(-)
MMNVCTQVRSALYLFRRARSIQVRMSSSISEKRWAKRVQGFETSVFAEFTPLAVKHGAVNLGQGFPNFEAPGFVLRAAEEAIRNGVVQYCRSQGHVRLVNALSAYFSPKFGRTINPMTEIMTSVGATEGLFATIMAIVNPDDEVILIEPFYDSYPGDIAMAHGVTKCVPLRPTGTSGSAADWRVDMDELAAAVTPKTRLIVVNNPQNIPGKVYTREELTAIADLAKKHDLLVLSDEVYEAMVYDGIEHTRIATLPGMWDRTLTLGSAGKSFSVTGFKVGWIFGPEDLITGVFKGHQFIPFCVATPMQDAIAVGFELALTSEKNYFPDLTKTYQAKRDKLCSLLEDAGLPTFRPQGSYFVLADTSRVRDEAFYNPADPSRRDVQFCRFLTKEIGVAAIPPSAFYSPEHAHLGAGLARFCFCKTDETLAEAEVRLKKLRPFLKS